MELANYREQVYYKLILLAGLVLGGVYYFYPEQMVLKLVAVLAVGLLVLYNTRAGLYLFALSFPFLPNTSVLLLAGLIGGAFLLKRLLRGKLALEQEQQVPVEPPLVIYMILITLATLFSVTLVGSIRDYVIYVFAFTLFYVLISQLDNREQLYRFITWLLLGSLLVSLYGVYQYIIGVPAESGWVDSTQNPDLQTRVFSVFGNPNILAEYLLLVIPYGLAVGLAVTDYRKKLIFFGITGAMAFTMLLTFSRGGWLALAVAIVLFALMKDRRLLMLIFLLGVVGIILLPFMPDVITQRLASIGNLQDSSNNYRIILWSEAITIIKDFWATGVGFGHLAFREVYAEYMITRTKTPFHVHNTYLQVLVEMGVLGFTVFMWLLVSIFKTGIKSLMLSKDNFVNYIIIASLAAIFGILVQGMSENIFYLPKIIMMFWINVAVLMVCAKLVGRETSSAPTQKTSSQSGADLGAVSNADAGKGELPNEAV